MSRPDQRPLLPHGRVIGELATVPAQAIHPDDSFAP